MWFFVTPILLTVAVALAYFVGKLFDIEGLLAPLVGIIGSVAALVLMFQVFPYAAGEHGETRLVSTETRDLQALGNDTATEGYGRGYYLSRGWVQEKQVITYIYENADGGFKLDRGNADESVIYEDEQDDPYVEISKYEMVPNGWFAPFVWYWTALDQFEFHVPEGSVSDEYVVSP